MRALEEKILREGVVLPGHILKVGSFLNQQIDVDFLMQMGKEIARLYEGCGVTKILTIEASGIAIAFAAAGEMHIPLLFAKKSRSANVSDEVYSASIHSYTHGNDYQAVVAKEFLSPADTVLLVDDFLANGAALEGLREIAKQAGARVAGAAVAIEKGFQHGGDALREKGLRVESLAIIESMTEDRLTFRQQ